MKRMIDYKEFLKLQDLASSNDLRLDYIEGAYTYFNLGLDDANFDHLLPGSPADLQPQTLRIGDTVYIEGVATTLDADMIKEIFDSNLVIIDCGSSPTSYPTVFLQRQYVDEGSGLVSPRNARFKAFFTYGVALYEYTMTVAEYDAEAQAGGYIVISCGELNKRIYFHSIEFVNTSTKEYFEFHILSNSQEPLNTWTKVDSWFKSIAGIVQAPGIGSIRINGVYYTLTIISKTADNSYTLTRNSDEGFVNNAFVFSSHFERVNDYVNRVF